LREVNQRSHKNKGGKLQFGKIVASEIAFYDWTAGMFSRKVGEAGRLFETGRPETSFYKP